jgi:hypothetical protein
MNTEHRTRVARYIAQGIPQETAETLVTYELANAGMTSTIDDNGKRVAA